MIISPSAMAGTEKSVLLVNISTMEEKKQNKSQAIIEVIEFGPSEDIREYSYKRYEKRQRGPSQGRSGYAGVENQRINHFATNRIKNRMHKTQRATI